MSRRVCFALDLVEDDALIAHYEAMHAPGAVPRDVIADIRARGFHEMEIWRVGNRCIMLAEVADDFPRHRGRRAQAVFDGWEGIMERYQRPLPQAAPGEKWVPMVRIFALDEQSEGTA